MNEVIGLMATTAGIMLILLDESTSTRNVLLTVCGGGCMCYVGLKLLGLV